MCIFYVSLTQLSMIITKTFRDCILKCKQDGEGMEKNSKFMLKPETITASIRWGKAMEKNSKFMLKPKTVTASIRWGRPWKKIHSLC